MPGHPCIEVCLGLVSVILFGDSSLRGTRQRSNLPGPPKGRLTENPEERKPVKHDLKGGRGVQAALLLGVLRIQNHGFPKRPRPLSVDPLDDYGSLLDLQRRSFKMKLARSRFEHLRINAAEGAVEAGDMVAASFLLEEPPVLFGQTVLRALGYRPKALHLCMLLCG